MPTYSGYSAEATVATPQTVSDYSGEASVTTPPPGDDIAEVWGVGVTLLTTVKGVGPALG